MHGKITQGIYFYILRETKFESIFVYRVFYGISTLESTSVYYQSQEWQSRHLTTLLMVNTALSHQLSAKLFSYSYRQYYANYNEKVHSGEDVQAEPGALHHGVIFERYVVFWLADRPSAIAVCPFVRLQVRSITNNFKI